MNEEVYIFFIRKYAKWRKFYNVDKDKSFDDLKKAIMC